MFGGKDVLDVRASGGVYNNQSAFSPFLPYGVSCWLPVSRPSIGRTSQTSYCFPYLGCGLLSLLD